MGSDYPFPIGDRAPRRVIAAAGFDAPTQAAIEGVTARHVFNRAGSVL